MIDFTDEMLERYSRHIILKDVGIEGQSRLLESSVLVIGTGGLGSPVALYLAAAGVGTLGLVDCDTVDLSNLQRQVIHFTPDVGTPKVQSAANKLRQLNPGITVNTHHARVDASNIRALVRQYDFVVDGTDNFAAKFLINDACVLEKKPFSHGGILRFVGQTTTILPGSSACYRCVFDAPPPPDCVPTCSQAGVLGAVAGMLGTIQAAEAVKFCTGAGSLLSNALLTFDAATMDFRKIAIRRRDSCRVCGSNPAITDVVDEQVAVCDLKRKT